VFWANFRRVFFVNAVGIAHAYFLRSMVLHNAPVIAVGVFGLLTTIWLLLIDKAFESDVLSRKAEEGGSL